MNSSNNAILVQSSVISSRLYQHAPNNSLLPVSGNSYRGSNVRHQVNQYPHQRMLSSSEPFINRTQTFDKRSNADADFYSSKSVVSLNKLASNINTKASEFMPHFKTSHRDLGMTDMPVREDAYQQSQRGNKSSHMSAGVHLRSPSRERQIEAQKGKSRGSFNQKHNNRKRNRSDISTESYESRSCKLQKTSEETVPNGTKRKQADQRAVSRRKVNLSKSEAKRSPHSAYNMAKLDLGHSIDKFAEQQQLKSRLNAMVYSNKVLREDEAIVVPSLPSILSLQSS